MHFFLNKSGWSAKYGWEPPHYLTYAEIKHTWQNALQFLAPNNWPPNMGETKRVVINPEWKKLGPTRNAFDKHPFRTINVGPAPKRLPHDPHHQTENPVG